MPLKLHLKTFNLEKITRHRGSKQAILKQEKINFKAITMRLRFNIYDFAGQFTRLNTPKACILKPKSNVFNLKKVKMKWSNHG